MSETELLEAVLQTCKLHAERLEFARAHLRAQMPLTAEYFRFQPSQELLICELFASRFAKLQDLMGSKLFGLVLEYAEEPVPPAFIDKLNDLEKLGCIESAARWRALRDMRNHISHEYPTQPELMAKNFNEAVQASDYLLACLESVERYISGINTKADSALI
jgi:hypothetical protein